MLNALHNITIKSFHEELQNKEFSALEIVQTIFARIKEHDGEIKAYLSLLEESAVAQAEKTDIALARGEEIEALAGAPLAIKDNILIKGHHATAGSKILENYIASYDATVIEKLKKENAVFLGKTNLDEFAMGSSTENSAFQTTRNPHDLERVPGGSSGGSAAAVAAHMALGALGSDTGGSIRQPAAFCGVVGLKPTYGAVSRSGVVALASSLDQIGPFAKTVEDAAILFKAIAGRDRMDSTTAETDYGEISHPDLQKIKNLTVGLPEEYAMSDLHPEIQAGMESAMAKLKSLGLKFKKISLPHAKYSLSCYYIIMPAEASANLARFDGIRYTRTNTDSTRTHADHQKSALENLYFETRGKGFGPEPKRRIILGTFVLSSGYYDAYYEKAQKVRALIKQDFENAFKEVDVIFSPVTPTPPFKIGEKTSDPLSMYLSDIFTIPVNLAGLPAISLPVEAQTNADFTQNDAEKIQRESASSPRKSASLPVGFQLIGKHFREADILGIGQYYEKLSS